jgi:Phage tail protein
MRASPAELVLVDADNEVVVRPDLSQPRQEALPPVVCRQWDPGAPTVREAGVYDRTGMDGTWDASLYTGSRTVALELAIFGDSTASAYEYTERLAAMTHPTRRPWLYVTRSGEGVGESWRIALRGTPFSLAYGKKAAAYLEMTLSFVAPDGYFESPLRERQSVGGLEVTTGLSLPNTFPVTFGSGMSSSTTEFTVAGSVPAPPVIYVYGPTTNPDIRTRDGDRFYVPGLSLAAGQFMAIDTAAGTVLLDGEPGASLFHLVDWSVSTFWRLTPGSNSIRLASAGGRLHIQWRERRFTV